MHTHTHPLHGKTVIFRMIDCDVLSSANVIDWLDRLDREVMGMDSLAAEQLYLNRIEATKIRQDDSDAIIGICKNEHDQPHIIVFHQSEIVTYEGHEDYNLIMMEAS